MNLSFRFALTLLLVSWALVCLSQSRSARERSKEIAGRYYKFKVSDPHLDRSLKAFYLAHELLIHEEADSLYPICLQQGRDLETKNDTAVFEFGLGYYWVRKQDYAEAQVHYSRAGALFEELDDKYGQLLTKVHMANLSYYMKQVQEAFDAYSEVLIDPSCGPYLASKMNHNCGALLMELERDSLLFMDQYGNTPSVEKIEAHLYKAIQFARSIDFDHGRAHTYSVFVNLKIGIGQFEVARAMIDSAQQIARHSGDEQRVAFLRIKEAALLDTLGYPEAAIDTALLAVNFFEKIQHLDQMNHALSMVYKLQMASGDFEGAAVTGFSLYENYHHLMDTTIARSTRRYRAEFENEKQAHQIQEQGSKLEQNRLKLSARNRLIISLALGILAIAGLSLYWIQRGKRKAQQKQDALVIKGKEDGIRSILLAQEEERQRIAKDLHDGIVQQLGGLKLGLQKTLGPDPESEKLLTLLDTSAQELHELSHRMMPRSLKELGLIPAMEDMLSNSLQHSEMEYSFEHFGVADRLPETIEITLYRIAQELINNVTKHSAASAVNVQLIGIESGIVLIVEDNGKGFKSGVRSTGIGLMNIASRLDTVNGNVRFDASPEGGTLATIKIPYDK